VETFRHVFVNKNGKFHRMMGDIYAQSRWVLNAFEQQPILIKFRSFSVVLQGATIAVLNLDELDG